jgi:hypothetical protein
MKRSPHKKANGVDDSPAILQELADFRIIAAGSKRASRTISDLTWQRAQSDAIERDDFRTVWYAGHVTAILTNDVDVIYRPRDARWFF